MPASGLRYNSNILLLIIFLAVNFQSCIEELEPQPPPDPGFTGQKGKITDREGNTYKTIGIGNQIWMAENLRSTKFNDSTDIQLITDSLIWLNTKDPVYCWYNNDTTMSVPYGALYNWYTINSGKLCPSGWHIPAEEDWNTLLDRLGGYKVAGGKVKVIGTDYWNKPNAGATNSSMFNAVSSGVNWSGIFSGFKLYCNWWSINDIETEYIWTPSIWYNRAYVQFDLPIKKSSGINVRCIKDQVNK